MTIRDNSHNNNLRRYTFADVKIGETFAFEYGSNTGFYMRIAPINRTDGNGFYRAIELRTGNVYQMGDNEEVALIDGEYLVNRVRKFATETSENS